MKKAKIKKLKKEKQAKIDKLKIKHAAELEKLSARYDDKINAVQEAMDELIEEIEHVSNIIVCTMCIKQVLGTDECHKCKAKICVVCQLNCAGFSYNGDPCEEGGSMRPYIYCRPCGKQELVKRVCGDFLCLGCNDEHRCDDWKCRKQGFDSDLY